MGENVIAAALAARPAAAAETAAHFRDELREIGGDAAAAALTGGLAVLVRQAGPGPTAGWLRGLLAEGAAARRRHDGADLAAPDGAADGAPPDAADLGADAKAIVAELEEMGLGCAAAFVAGALAALTLRLGWERVCGLAAELAGDLEELAGVWGPGGRA